MAHRSIIFSWGAPHIGRETLSVDVFQQALKFSEKQKQDGKISNWSVGLANEGNVSDFAGYIVVEGTTEQINELRGTREYQKLVIKARHVAAFTAVECCGSSEIAGRMEQLLSSWRELGST